MVSISRAAATDHPNVLILLADDLGDADLSCQGARDVSTPNIDTLAENGIRFTSGYVSAPVCSPSRAGLITGRSGTRFGHEFNHPLADRAPIGMPVTEKTAAQWFKQGPYVTGHIGKWHLGNPKIAQYSPNARGFDEDVWFPGQNKLPPLTYYRNGVPGKASDIYVDEAMAREAGDFIKKHSAQPWFLYVAFLTPHEPVDTPPGSENAFASVQNPKRRKFDAALTLLDDSVGHVLKSLHDNGLDKNTLVVFLSDNGAEPGNGSSNAPLSGMKGTTWEGGIREPFLMQWKSVLPAGKVIDTPVSSLDLLPTGLAAAHINVPAGSALEGTNLLPFLTGQTQQAPHDALFWRYGTQWAVRQGDWKLVSANINPVNASTGTMRLINLKDDISELHDLSAQNPEKVRDLQALWNQWNIKNVAPLWVNNSPEDDMGAVAEDSQPAPKTADQQGGSTPGRTLNQAAFINFSPLLTRTSP